MDFKMKTATRDKEAVFTIIKRSVHQEDLTVKDMHQTTELQNHAVKIFQN